MFVPQLNENEFKTDKEFKNEYHCQIRIRLGVLTGKTDFWWPLGENYEAIGQEIITGLKNEGRQWFDLYSSIDNICINWGRAPGSAIRAKLDVAMLTIGKNREEGERLFREYFSEVRIPGHKGYVKQLAREFGLEL